MTLLANLKNIDKKLLCSDDVIKLLLIRCVQKANMTPLLHTLYLEHFPILTEKGSVGGHGVTGFLVLVESHIAIHTWVEYGYARLELSSCKKFDPEPVVEAIKTILDCDVEYSALEW